MDFPVELPDVIAKKRAYKIDKNDILIEKIPYKDFYVHNPTMIASCALRYDHEPSIEWIIKNMDEEGVVKHNYQSEFSPSPGWIGGLSQALVACALMKYGYESLAQKAIDAMLKHCYKDGIIYERPGQIILNGWMYAIIALDMCGRENEVKESLFALTQALPLFDAEFWSCYDATWIMAPPFYHNIHCEQIKYLYELLDNDVLREYARKWVINKNWKRAKRKRQIQLIKRHGIIGCFKQARRYRKWLKTK